MFPIALLVCYTVASRYDKYGSSAYSSKNAYDTPYGYEENSYARQELEATIEPFNYTTSDNMIAIGMASGTVTVSPLDPNKPYYDKEWCLVSPLFNAYNKYMSTYSGEYSKMTALGINYDLDGLRPTNPGRQISIRISNWESCQADISPTSGYFIYMDANPWDQTTYQVPEGKQSAKDCFGPIITGIQAQKNKGHAVIIVDTTKDPETEHVIIGCGVLKPKQYKKPYARRVKYVADGYPAKYDTVYNSGGGYKKGGY